MSVTKCSAYQIPENNHITGKKVELNFNQNCHYREKGLDQRVEHMLREIAASDGREGGCFSGEV